jgi:hypothetical protein
MGRVRLPFPDNKVKDSIEGVAQNRQLIHIFFPAILGKGGGGEVWNRGCAMPELLDAPATVVDFREEARGCLQLAKAETHSEVRTILMGMALGWLKLANHLRSDALQLEPADVHHNG